MSAQSPIPEGVVSLAQALIETPDLRSWFYSLETLSDAARNAAFTRMATRMRDASEDAELISAVRLLAHPQMYDLVLAAVRDRTSEAVPNT